MTIFFFYGGDLGNKNNYAIQDPNDPNKTSPAPNLPGGGDTVNANVQSSNGPATGSVSVGEFDGGTLANGTITANVIDGVTAGDGGGSASVTANTASGGASAAAGGLVTISSEAKGGVLSASLGGKITATGAIIDGGAQLSATGTGTSILASAIVNDRSSSTPNSEYTLISVFSNATVSATDIHSTGNEGMRTTVGVAGGTPGGTLIVDTYDVASVAGLTSTLSIGTGGTVQINTAIAIGTRLGDNDGVDIRGIGAQLIYAGTLIVGGFGNGTLTIGQGATPTLAALDIGAQYNKTNENGLVGVQGSGTSLTISQDVTLADAGRGELTIALGASATVKGNLTTANQSTAAGGFTVSGANASLTVDGRLTVGNRGVDIQSDVYGGGALNALGGFTLGAEQGARGIFYAQDPHSVVTTGSSAVTVGAYGHGEIHVLGGATFDASGGDIDVGAARGSNGQVFVTQGFSSPSQGGILKARDLTVGTAGYGYVDVAGGASATVSGNLIAGAGDGGSGNIFVSDPNTQLEAGNVRLGNTIPDPGVPDNGKFGIWKYIGTGLGGLTVSDHAALAVDKTVTLQGQPLFLFTSATAEIGGHGGNVPAAEMLVDAGGTVTGHGQLGSGTIVNNGKVIADQGTLIVSADASGAGSYQIDDNAILELGGAFSGAVTFNGGYESILKLDTAKVFTSVPGGLRFNGTIGGLANGDTIEFVPRSWGSLADQKFAHAAIAGSNLVITLQNNQTISFALSGDVSNHTFNFRILPNDHYALTYEPSNPKIATGVPGAPTGNPYVDSLINGWGAWKANQGPVTYSFGTAGDVKSAVEVHGDTSILPYQKPAVDAWTAQEMQDFQTVLQTYSSVTGLQFQQANSADSANMVWWLVPNIPTPDANKLVLGESELPADVPDGHLWQYFVDKVWTPDTLAFGGDGYGTIVHELGHTLGLAHPHDGGNEPDGNTFPGVASDQDQSIGQYGQNQAIFTVMSYIAGWNGVAPNPPPQTYGTQGGLGAFDIAALQQLYGANTTANAGDNTYALPAGNQPGTGWSCIWDPGGNNTISNAGSNIACTIDLRAAPLTGDHAGGYVSHAVGILGGFTIAHGTIIQNAIGGNASDVLIGGSDANVNYTFTGGGGNDSIFGGTGKGDVNTAVYSGVEAEYTVVQIRDGGWTVTDDRPQHPDGTDRLYNIQNVRFQNDTPADSSDDTIVLLPNQGPAIAIYPINNGQPLTAAEAQSPLVIGGWASVAGQVSVSFAGNSYFALTDQNGSWGAVVLPAALDPSALSDGNYTVQAQISDAVGNFAVATASLTVDETVAHIVAIATAAPNSDLNEGQTAQFTVIMSKGVVVEGAPTLSLSDNEVATFDAAATAALNDSTRLAFDYTVQAGDQSAALQVTAVNVGSDRSAVAPGASIADSFGNPANLSLAGVSGVSTGLRVDAPAVKQVTASPATGPVNTGAAVAITLTMTEGVTVAGTPLLNLSDGAIATYDAGTSAPSSGTLVFDYTVASGDHARDLSIISVNPNGSTIKGSQGAGNAADLSGAVTDLGLQVNTPAIVRVSTDASSSNLSTGQTLHVTLTMNEPVTVSGSPTLSLSDNVTAMFDAAMSAHDPTTIVFDYTVGPGDYTDDLQVTAFDINGAVIADSSGNAASSLPLDAVPGTDTGLHINAAHVTSVVVAPGGGNVKAGRTAAFTLTLSAGVTVAGGTPTLNLSNDAVASYDPGATAALSDPTKLVFGYLVGTNDIAADLQVLGIAANGATIADGAGNPADLSLFGVAGLDTGLTVNNHPTILSSVPASASLVPKGALQLAPALTVTDAGSTTLVRATVQVTDGTFSGDQDVLAASTGGTSISASYDSISETLTLSGSDSLANYQAVLRSVTFSSNAQDPANAGTDPSRTVEWVADDGTDTSAPEFELVSVGGPSMASVAGSAIFLQQGTAVALSPSLTLADAASTTLASATVQVSTGGFSGDQDALAAITTGTAITASYSSANETLTLTGKDSLADYQAVLRSVTFASSSADPTQSGAHLTRTLSWSINDDASASSPASTTVYIYRLPALTVTGNGSAKRGQQLALSTLVTIADPDQVGFQKLELVDSNGTAAGGQLVVNGAAQTGGHEIDVLPANVAGAVYDVGTAGGTDTLYARLLQSNGQLTAWQSFAVTAPPDTPPTVQVASTTATHGQSFAAATLVTAGDGDGDSITQYQLYDVGSGGAHLATAGVADATGALLTLSAVQFAQTIYQSGSGADTLVVRAHDGNGWSGFGVLTVTAPVDFGATLTAPNISAAHNHTLAASSLITASDADGDSITQYQLYDVGAGGGALAVNGLPQPAGALLTLSAAQFAQTTYLAGTGTDILAVRAFDGYVYSAFAVFTVTDTPPTVVAPSIVAGQSHTFAGTSLVSASDSDGDAVTQYQLYDVGAGGAQLAVNNVPQPNGALLTLSATQFAQLTYTAGRASDTLVVRAFDGAQYSPFAIFTVTDTPPTVIAPSIAAGHLHTFAGSSLVSATDADGDAVTQYQLYDVGAGGAQFSVNNTVQPSGTLLTLSAAQFAQTTYTAGFATDTLVVRASDGVQFSPFMVFTVTDTPPTVTVQSLTKTVSGQTFAASSLVTASDADGDDVMQYQLYDVGAGGGQLIVNGAPQPSGTLLSLTAAQFALTVYKAGTSSDTLAVRAFDGVQYSAFQVFTVSDPDTIAAGETLELTSAYAGKLTFLGPDATLQLDDSGSFAGTVAGIAEGDAIDLRDIDPGHAKLSYSGDGSGGMLSITGGARSASIALLGNYLASIFATSSDGHGGTKVDDSLPMSSAQPILTAPHA